MHRAPIPALPDDIPAESDEPSPSPGAPSEDEPVPDHNPSLITRCMAPVAETPQLTRRQTWPCRSLNNFPNGSILNSCREPCFKNISHLFDPVLSAI
jgi:hypothetical protein